MKLKDIPVDKQDKVLNLLIDAEKNGSHFYTKEFCIIMGFPTNAQHCLMARIAIDKLIKEINK